MINSLTHNNTQLNASHAFIPLYLGEKSNRNSQYNTRATFL
ncbi:unnamed protein product, partial [Linum tenue]